VVSGVKGSPHGRRTQRDANHPWGRRGWPRRPAEFAVILHHLAQAPNGVFQRWLPEENLTTRGGFSQVESNQQFVDVVALRSLPLHDALTGLIGIRSVESRPKKLGLIQLFEPINPLLISTAIAAALVSGHDDGETLGLYASGSPLPRAYDSLLRLPQYTDELLAEHLRIEEELIEKFCVLSMGWVGADRLDVWPPPLPVESAQGRDEWLRLDAAADGGDWQAQADRDAVRWGTWLLANPVLCRVNPETVQQLLCQEGFAHNTEIHEAREQMERLTAHRDTEFNALLRGKLEVNAKRTALKQAKAKRALAVRVLERVRRFYLWNPLEIEARWFSSIGTMAVFGSALPTEEVEEEENNQ
jgi:hypothetical protein